MKELLKNAGFIETEWENEWSKDEWTIRLFENEIEAFNEPRINTPGVYYKCLKSEERLQTILEDIKSIK